MSASFSARDGLGMAAYASSTAASLSIPVGAPAASRTITPWAGSGVARVMPAFSSARELSQAECPS
jgi:hypothetical protein